MAALLLNHALFQDVGDRPPTEVAAELGALLQVRSSARRFMATTVYVHEEIWNVRANRAGTPLRTWAARAAYDPNLRDVSRLLLSLCDQGPYLSQLEVDDDGAVENILPWPETASAWVFAVLERGLHHRLSAPAAPTWVVSVGSSRAELPEPRYAGARGAERADIDNLLDAATAAASFQAVAAQDIRDSDDLLRRVERACSQVRILPRVRRSISTTHVSVSPAALYEALVGLQVVARAVDEGQRHDLAYYEVTGVRISDESDSVKRNRRLRRLREFTIPGDARPIFFGWHAKFAQGMRVHLAWRTEGVGDEAATVVYVGYVGPHLPGARG